MCLYRGQRIGFADALFYSSSAIHSFSRAM